MHLKAFETIRHSRFVNLVLLLICVALAGLLWTHVLDKGHILEIGLVYQHDYWVTAFAILLTCSSLVLAFGHEMLAATMQHRAEEIHEMHRRLMDDMSIHSENAKEQEHVIQKLAQESHDLREQLLTNQLHEMHDRQARELAEQSAGQADHGQLPHLRSDCNSSTRFRRSG